MSFVIGGGVGFVVGCFCPAIARKVKALFVKEGQAAKASALAAAAKKVL